MIDSGRAVRLQRIRDEVRDLKNRPIKSLEQVRSGIAQLNNKLKELEEAGGQMPTPDERKHDLHNILPTEIKDKIMWYAIDDLTTYERFEETVETQTAKMLLHKRRTGVNCVHNHSPGEGGEVLARGELGAGHPHPL